MMAVYSDGRSDKCWRVLNIVFGENMGQIVDQISLRWSGSVWAWVSFSYTETTERSRVE
jgi:hypothetical protein